MENDPVARNDGYLWDRTGDPDPEIQKLEGLLGSFRHDRQAPVFPQIVPDRKRRIWPWRMRLVPLFAASAAMIAIAAFFFFVHRSRITSVALGDWSVFRLTGSPRFGRMESGAEGGLQGSEFVETDKSSRASLRAEDIGQIEIEPGTRVRLLKGSAGFKRIALDHGTIYTYIWAPPGQFVVDTPSARTVDLGCAYTLHVDDSGAGLVRTYLGWVGFKLNGRESFIPAGAACATRPGVGPGTPYFESASPTLRAALHRFDFEDITAEQRSSDLAVVLRSARKVDALTLWHLLSRVDERDRVLVFNELRGFVPLPQGASNEGVLRLDQAMLDQWWNHLGFDDISVWRHWERSWPEQDSAAGPKY